MPFFYALRSNQRSGSLPPVPGLTEPAGRSISESQCQRLRAASYQQLQRQFAGAPGRVGRARIGSIRGAAPGGAPVQVMHAAALVLP